MALGRKPAQINRTPAPKQDLKTGGESYGQANDVDTPASLPPSVGGPQTALGKKSVGQRFRRRFPIGLD